MDAGLLISINLPGQIGPPVAHTTKQVFSANVAPIGTVKPEILTRKIKHTDRGVLPATKEMKISPAVVDEWKNGGCPFWADPKVWKKLTKEQKVAAHVMRFDEGYGINYE